MKAQKTLLTIWNCLPLLAGWRQGLAFSNLDQADLAWYPGPAQRSEYQPCTGWSLQLFLPKKSRVRKESPGLRHL